MITTGLLTPDDAAAWQALRLQGLRECPSAFASSAEEEAGTALSVIAQRLQAAPDRALLGAWRADRLIGTVGLQRESMRKLAHKAFLWGMYVEPAARGLGVGRELVAAALAHARDVLGVRQVLLGVNEDNHGARALYERMGFTVFGREPGFLWVDGVLHDELHMLCVLDPGPRGQGGLSQP